MTDTPRPSDDAERRAADAAASSRRPEREPKGLETPGLKQSPALQRDLGEHILRKMDDGRPLREQPASSGGGGGDRGGGRGAVGDGGDQRHHVRRSGVDRRIGPANDQRIGGLLDHRRSSQPITHSDRRTQERRDDGNERRGGPERRTGHDRRDEPPSSSDSSRNPSSTPPTMPLERQPVPDTGEPTQRSRQVNPDRAAAGPFVTDRVGEASEVGLRPGSTNPDGSREREASPEQVAAAADVEVATTFLPHRGGGSVAAHAVEGNSYPERQHDSGGARPMEKPDPALAEDLRRAGPAAETLYKGGRLESASVDGWKEALDAGQPVTMSITPERPTSTSRDSTVALAYAKLGAEASQMLGKPNRAMAVTEPSDVLPDDRPIAGHEELAKGRRPGEIGDRISEARGDQEVGHLERLRETVGDEGHPPTPHTDRARIDDLNEVLICGEFDLVGLMDTRPGHEYERGDVDAVRVPGGGPTPPGVYPAFRPVPTDTGA